jgi:hypothetical protein
MCGKYGSADTDWEEQISGACVSCPTAHSSFAGGAYAFSPAGENR